MCGLSYLELMERWKLWIRPLVIMLYIVLLTILLPLLVYNAYKNGFTQSHQLFLIGGLFVFMAVPISLWDIVQHMVHYHQPYLQRSIIRILWMVPLYACNAWLGLAFPAQSVYIDSIRECYEAYVIYNFMVYLLNFLNSETYLATSLQLKPQVYHFFPLCFLPPWEMGREFIHYCKHGILQYTAIRPLTAIISFLCQLNDVYGDGSFTKDVAYPYILAINNLSQFIAMYCLVLFYRANREELAPIKPIGKFLCIKAVVFFSFLQGMVIAVLASTGILSTLFNDQIDPQLIASRIQDLLICGEMFLAAIAHHYCFSYVDFLPDKEDLEITEVLGCWGAFTAMWDLSDVHRDVREHIGVVGGSLSRSIRGQRGYKSLPTENSLLVPELETERNYSTLNDPGPSTSTDEIAPRRQIDKTATEAEEIVKSSMVVCEGAKTVMTGRGILIHSPDEQLIDIAPEVGFISGHIESKTPIA